MLPTVVEATTRNMLSKILFFVLISFQNGKTVSQWELTQKELENFRKILNDFTVNQNEVRKSANDHTLGTIHKLRWHYFLAF